MTNQEYIDRLTPIANKYSMTVKESTSGQVVIIDRKGRLAGYIDKINNTVIAKMAGRQTLLGSLALYPMIKAIRQ